MRRSPGMNRLVALAIPIPHPDGQSRPPDGVEEAMDEADLANDRAEQFTTDALKLARAKMDAAPSTGICQSCRDAIEVERLHANPAARLCRDCAAEEEADRKRRQKVGG